jgi:ABC-type bacteriocin/lantibiotic exporter with double-glycine peptidase domain
MRLSDVLQPARAVSTGLSVRRGALVAVLALAERLLAPASAWIVLERPGLDKWIAVFVFGAVFTVRSFAQNTLRARAEAELFDRVIAALLHGDVLRSSVLEEQDARAELGQAVFHCAQTLSYELPTLAADIAASAVLGLVVLAVEPPRLVLLAATLTLVAGLALLWSRGRIQRAVADLYRAQEGVYQDFIDALEGRLEVVASGQRGPFTRTSKERTRAWGDAGARVATAALLSGRIPLLGIAVLVGASIAASGRWHGALAFDWGDIALLATVTPAFAGLAQDVHALARSAPRVAMVAEVLRDAGPSWEGTRSVPELPASIAFEGISFRYDRERNSVDALRDVSFGFGKKSVLALSGANGSGKSTCLRLLLGLAKPTAGCIRVDGVDLADLDMEAWRAGTAFLPQRPYLPPRSCVRASIRFLAPAVSDERACEALQRVGVWTALQRATVGSLGPLDAPVDALSVGQRQRIALARLLCRDASLFVLDEPDANLDRAGVALVAELVRELAKQSVVVFAAHTDELLRVADRVVVLDGGIVTRDESVDETLQARC